MKTAVFLLNMGGPDSMEAIEPFLKNLFSDPEILKFPLSGLVQKPLAAFIARKRAPKVAEHYRHMGGKSPLRAMTERQAALLAQALGDDYTVHVAMRYWHPFADEAVAAAKAANPERVLLLPLYPHYSRATTGSSLADMEAALVRGGLGALPRTVVRSWEDFPPYIDTLAAAIEETLDCSGEELILFSAHSLPMKLIEQGDPYQRHIETTVAAVMARFPGYAHRLAYQSRTGPVAWLGPSMEEVIAELGAAKVKKVVVLAVSFVSDHIETLCEIDVQYRDLALAKGVGAFVRAPAPNDRPLFIEALRQKVGEALG